MESNYLPILFLISLGILACGGQEDSQDSHTAAGTYCLDSAFRERITFTNPSLKKVEEAIHLTGSVEADPDRVVSFVSLVSGVVTSVNFSIGDRVRKGQILAEMRSAELGTLKSELASLTSKIEVAEKKLEAVRVMYADGVSSQKDLLEAQSELLVLKSEHTRTSEHLELYSASVSDGVFRIKAPASGIVTQKTITAGSQLSPESGALFTISDLSRVWILANIYATNIRDIIEGMEVEITTLSYPDEQFPGKISTISSVMDKEAKVLTARIELPNHEMKLKPGMLVDIRAFKPSDHTALSLPTSTLVFDDNRNYVVVYKSDCELAIRRVEILAQNHNVTYLADGPDSTDTIVSQNQLLIFEQLKNFQD